MSFTLSHVLKDWTRTISQVEEDGEEDFTSGGNAVVEVERWPTFLPRPPPPLPLKEMPIFVVFETFPL